jgi:protein-ribulosamine 3-kinase
MLYNVPPAIRERLVEVLPSQQSSSIQLINFEFLAGGCINKGGRLQTNFGDFFIKWNDGRKFPEMFEVEAKGLTLLAETKTIRIPKVIAQANEADHQFLVLEFIAGYKRNKNYWQILGVQLAQMHRNSSTYFGLDHDNYIGSLPQRNKTHTRWADFFINERLNPLLIKSVDEQILTIKQVNDFELLYKKLPSLIPEEAPALLHGDLWSGNVMTDKSGMPVLIDPAVYYGHREMDLAFTTLFGGFDPMFYKGYDAEFPLIPGFDQRMDIYNLYPLLVHALLFGGGYLAQALAIVKRFSK